MKTLMQLKPIFASIMLGGAFILAPIAASANSTTTPQSHVQVATVITTDGLVRVAGATITAVSGNVINATTMFGNNILNWILNVSADTKIIAGGTANASTTALKVGDPIQFMGNLSSSTGSVLVVNSKVILDATSTNMSTHLKGMFGKHGKDNDGDNDDSATSTPRTHFNKGLHMGAFLNLNHFFGNER